MCFIFILEHKTSHWLNIWTVVCWKLQASTMCGSAGWSQVPVASEGLEPLSTGAGTGSSAGFPGFIGATGFALWCHSPVKEIMDWVNIKQVTRVTLDGQHLQFLRCLVKESWIGAESNQSFSDARPIHSTLSSQQCQTSTQPSEFRTT